MCTDALWTSLLSLRLSHESLLYFCIPTDQGPNLPSVETFTFIYHTFNLISCRNPCTSTIREVKHSYTMDVCWPSCTDASLSTLTKNISTIAKPPLFFLSHLDNFKTLSLPLTQAHSSALFLSLYFVWLTFTFPPGLRLTRRMTFRTNPCQKVQRTTLPLETSRGCEPDGNHQALARLVQGGGGKTILILLSSCCFDLNCFKSLNLFQFSPRHFFFLSCWKRWCGMMAVSSPAEPSCNIRGVRVRVDVTALVSGKTLWAVCVRSFVECSC